MTINLFGPGMTAMHKAGLAGLWMTLEAFENNACGQAVLDHGSWERGPTWVNLYWHKEPDDFFKALFKEAFKIDQNGLVWFPALGEPMDNPQHAVVLQEALLGSFLQHGRTRRSDPSAKPGGEISVTFDDDTEVLRYHRLSEYNHQKSSYSPSNYNALAGWLYPGGIVRHTGFGQVRTALEESPERALALRFAPIGVVYFEVRSRSSGVRPRHAIVVPEISDLERYSAIRRSFVKYGVQNFFAAGSADAGYRVLTQLKAENLLDDISSAFCRVMSFGTVPWAKQQKTRVNLATVRVGSESQLETFEACCNFFEARRVTPEAGDAYWDVPQIPDLVAQNLNGGKRWWMGFADFVAEKDRREHVFRYEKGGLAKMVRSGDRSMAGTPEEAFVQACHEAWRRRMGQISEKAKREGSSFRDQAAREFERLRVSFSRCKNATSLREVVTGFWARGGAGLKPLQERWRDVLVLLDDSNWRKAKDLALLALASYTPVTKEEADAMDASQKEGESDNE